MAPAVSPKAGLSTLGTDPAPFAPQRVPLGRGAVTFPLSPSCQRRVAWHRGQARHIHPELIQLLDFPARARSIKSLDRDSIWLEGQGVKNKQQEKKKQRKKNEERRSGAVCLPASF